MPFVPASPTRLFPRRQQLGKMQKLRKLNPKRDSQTKVNKTPEAVLNDPLLSGSLSQHDLITTKLSQDSTSPAKEASGSSTDSSTQQDIFAALADTAAFAEAASVSGKEDQASMETATEPEHLFEEDTAPIVGRASSVRVSKPQIVQHKHTKKARLQVKNMDSIDETDDQDGPSARIPRETDATVDRRSSAVSQSAISASSKDTTANSASDKGPSEFEPVPAHTPGLPTGGTVHSIHPSIVDADIPTVSSSNQDHNETAPVPGINTTMSSPLPLPGKGLSRRVTIRPADLIIKNHDRDGPSTFRESVVTTPYPARMNSDASSLDFDAEKKQNEMKAPTSRAGRDKARRGVSFTAAPGSKDRFPSPERPEVLFIDLNLSRHPCARTTIEIQIAGKSTFDDEMLFNQIRAAYTKQLLGSTRLLLLLVRRLGYVSVTVPTNYDASEFNGVDFMRNLSNPNYGHKRKAWVIWLRKNNPQSASRLSSILMHPAPVRQIDNLNRLSSLRTRSLGHSRQGSRNRTDSTDCNEENKRFRTISDASSFHFVYSPAMPRLPFLSSKDNSEPQVSPTTQANATVGSPVRSFFWPSNLSSSLSTASRMGNESTDTESNRILTLSFQHEYRIGVIAFLTFMVALQAVVGSIIWVIFGVPGTRPGGNESYVTATTQKLGRPDWKIDSKGRVLTGLVIGLVMLILGCLFEGALVLGSWLLL